MDKMKWRRIHLNAVMGWGYGLAQAWQLCRANKWFGDARAQ